MAQQYFIMYNGQQVGPMSVEQLKAYGLKADSMVWAEGLTDWVAAYTIPELMVAINSRPAAPAAPAVPATSGKRIAAGVIAILVGYLGIHYFICGKSFAGFITILLSLVTCGVWTVVTFVQGIMMLCMSDADFDNKYVNSTSIFPLF